MTIGIIIKFKDGVVLACDSQATAGGGAPYKKSTSKLEQLDTYHGLVLAGAEPISRQVTYMLREQLQKEQKADTAKIADMTSDLMSSLYRTYATRFGKDAVGIAGELPSELLIGGWDENGGPQIYAVSSPGIFSPVDDFGLIGSGTFYAGTIMKKEFFPNMPGNRAQFLATRAVVEASEMDPYVGGKIRMATIHPRFQGFLEIPDYAEQRFKPQVEELATLIRKWEDDLFGRDESNP